MPPFVIKQPITRESESMPRPFASASECPSNNSGVLRARLYGTLTMTRARGCAAGRLRQRVPFQFALPPGAGSRRPGFVARTPQPKPLASLQLYTVVQFPPVTDINAAIAAAVSPRFVLRTVFCRSELVVSFTSGI